MGSVLSCCLKSRKKQWSAQRANERTRLLETREATHDIGVWHRNDNYSDESVRSLIGVKTDEQNNRIVSNSNKCVDSLAAKMIDISTIDQPIDRMEWKRREELYQRRMAKMERKLVLRSKLMAKPVVEISLSDSIDEEDLQLINDLAERASHAVHNGFRVICNEPVVVPFMP